MIGKIEMDLFKTSFKEVYAELMRSRKKPANIWVEKWENDLGINSEEWEGIWRNVHCHMLNPYVQSTVWETLHRNYMCAYFAQIAFNNQMSVCFVLPHKIKELTFLLNAKLFPSATGIFSPVLTCYSSCQ